MGKHNNGISRTTVWFIFGCILLLRYLSMPSYVLSWDVFGYYLYLPAIFIHGDPLLTDISWIHAEMESRLISTTLYQLSTSPEGGMMFFFFMGMAFLYLPFFLLAHAIALVFGFPADGFSAPYQLCLAWGFTIYTLIGLFYLRRIMLRFFSDGWSGVLMIAVVLGTNLYHFTAVKNLETANPLFALFAMVVWYTIRWHETYENRYLYRIAGAAAMMALVKPSEIVCLIIPVLWGVSSIPDLHRRIELIWNKRFAVLTGVGIAILVFFPQMIYWMVTTGYPIYDSYQNPGVGLDLASPHTIDAFFGFRKGWLIYTPIMWFAMFGFVMLYRSRRDLFWPILTYFVVTSWIITSWSEWWYGASYSIRPMTTSYVLLAIPMGLFLRSWFETDSWKRWVSIGIPMLFIGLNIFQMWQFRNYILHPYSTTKDYYFAVFGKTEITDNERRLLAWERPLDPEPEFTDRDEYDCHDLPGWDTEPGDIGDPFQLSEALKYNEAATLGGERYYGLPYKFAYDQLTDQDHAWLSISAMVYLPKDFNNERIFLTVSLKHLDGDYGYRAFWLNDPQPGRWNTVSGTYLTPEIREESDTVGVYVWTKKASLFYYDDIRVEVCERNGTAEP